MSDKEYKVLKANYNSFCNFLKAETGLLPHFVQADIINEDDSQDIMLKPPSQKGAAILSHVMSPAQSGLTVAFYAMVGIMKVHGKADTRAFARKIEKELGISDDTSDHEGMHTIF